MHLLFTVAGGKAHKCTQTSANNQAKCVQFSRIISLMQKEYVHCDVKTSISEKSIFIVSIELCANGNTVQILPWPSAAPSRVCYARAVVGR